LNKLVEEMTRSGLTRERDKFCVHFSGGCAGDKINKVQNTKKQRQGFARVIRAANSAESELEFG
jgi:hypothetical protein